MLLTLSYPRRNVRALSTALDRVRFGSQAFWQNPAFNADIGAWNTASVTTLSWVCAAFGPAARHRGGKRSAGARCGAALVRGGAADARACERARMYTYSLPRMSEVCTQLHAGKMESVYTWIDTEPHVPGWVDLYV